MTWESISRESGTLAEQQHSFGHEKAVHPMDWLEAYGGG